MFWNSCKKLIEEGYEAYTLILGEGENKVEMKRRVVENKKDELDILNSEIKNANDIIGIKKTFIYNFPDNRFDSVIYLIL